MEVKERLVEGSQNVFVVFIKFEKPVLIFVFVFVEKVISGFDFDYGGLVVIFVICVDIVILQ